LNTQQNEESKPEPQKNVTENFPLFQNSQLDRPSEEALENNKEFQEGEVIEDVLERGKQRHPTNFELILTRLILYVHFINSFKK
jgi:hypothetical protein